MYGCTVIAASMDTVWSARIGRSMIANSTQGTQSIGASIAEPGDGEGPQQGFHEN